MATQGAFSGVRIAQTVGITTSALLSGYIFTVSYSTVPLLLQSQSQASAFDEHFTSLKNWASVYAQGVKVAPSLAAIAFTNFTYIAYRYGVRTCKGKVYAAAGCLCLSIIPFTLAAIRPVNNKLFELLNLAERLGDSKMTGLPEERRLAMQKWSTLNYIRGLFPLAGAIVALRAVTHP